jgi:hypothetical protein
MTALEAKNNLLSFWAHDKRELSPEERRMLEGEAMVVSFTAYEILLQPVDHAGCTVVVVARDPTDPCQQDVKPDL